MTVLVQIRDVDERVRDELKSRAAVEETTLNASPEVAARAGRRQPRRSDVFERSRARSERSGTPSAEVIRAGRDARGAIPQG